VLTRDVGRSGERYETEVLTFIVRRRVGSMEVRVADLPVVGAVAFVLVLEIDQRSIHRRFVVTPLNF
jgi:hypothetical protein